MNIYYIIVHFNVRGEKQRVSIARALVTNPKLIVADEPTGNLDSKNSHELMSILKDLNEKEGVTILLVTHDSMIASYAKQFIYVHDGKIQTTLNRNDKDQQIFFNEIVNINAGDYIKLFFKSN